MKEFIFKLFGWSYIQCHNCETLKLLLEQERKEKIRLLEQIFKEPEKLPEVVREPMKPLNMKVPLEQMRKRLEFQSRIEQENKQKVEELEKELLINEGN